MHIHIGLPLAKNMNQAGGFYLLKITPLFFWESSGHFFDVIELIFQGSF